METQTTSCPLRILIDGIAFENPFQIGVQRLFREMLCRIGTSDSVSLFTTEKARAELPAHCRIISRSGAVRSAGRFDLFQSTRFTLSPEPMLPQVLAIHDMVPELHWRYTETHMAQEVESKRRAGDAASRITCISQATAADIRRVYPDWSDKIRVVYCGADHLVHREGERRDDGRPPRISRRPWRQWAYERRARRKAAELRGRPYVLFVGDRHAYKNFAVVLQAMAQPAWETGLMLAVVGTPFGPQEEEEIRRMGLEGRLKWLGRVSDSRLRQLYTDAACFVFPSLAEGFGFPLLEAQVTGTRLICSDIPVFREIAGEHASYFNPRDPSAVAAAVAGARERPLTEDERQRARQNVARFQWDRCAAQTLEVYREATQAGAARTVSVTRS